MQLGLDLQSAPSAPRPPKIHSVTEVTRRIRELIEEGIGEVWVEGEISNVRRQASGHQYFTLKDSSCQLSCVLFSGAAAALRGLKLTDGQSIQAFGAISVYEPRGQYQMIVRLVQERGEGALQAKFEALKRKLAAEGIFDPARKRPLPHFPRRIGLVTSPTGAAIRDFLNVLHRRHPGIEVYINPVRVQGKGASTEIARAIREFGEAEKHGLPAMDVLVVTRGGGSIEDLWEFNEETVARAIAASLVPVVSAVGHEIDFTIADFAADLRAATPSAAAEILAADRVEVLASLRQNATRMTRACRGRMDLAEARLTAISQSTVLREPARRILELRQTLDRSADAIHQGADLTLERRKAAIDRAATRLAAQFPAGAIRESRLHCGMVLQRISEPVRRKLTAHRARLDRASGILGSLSPEATLSRGFTITMDGTGKPLTSSKNIAEGMALRTRFHDGEAKSTVEG